MLTEINYNNLHYFVDENNYLQGNFIMRDENSQVTVRCSYVDNKKHGEYKSQWSNGQLGMYCFYVNDNLHGEYKEWLSNGELFKHCFYINGKHTTFDELPYPTTPEEITNFKMKHDLQLIENS